MKIKHLTKQGEKETDATKHKNEETKLQTLRQQIK